MRRSTLIPLLAAGALLVTACGDDGGTAKTDTTPSDTFTTDTSVTDTTNPTDTLVVDSTDPDTLVEDTGPDDTTATDTMVEDTTETDTAVEDTTETDTTVEDTTATDTTAEDTTETDTAEADTTETDTTQAYDPTTQIAAVRAATPSDTLDLPVEGAFVTYLKASFSNEPAGFFVQGDQVGPALFVSVDPLTLTPVPAVGDMVSFTVTATESGSTGLLVTGISSLSVLSSDNEVSGLEQDVSAATDLVSAVTDYEHELVTATLTIAAGGFYYAGNGFEQVKVDTEGLTGADLTFRVPPGDPNKGELVETCVVDVGPVPVWYYAGSSTTVELTVDSTDDYEIVSCPAPELMSAAATSSTTVALGFSRTIDPASVAGDGSDFTISGVTISAAAVNGKSVTLTVGELAIGDYTVTVGAGVTDTLGSAVATDANSAMFSVAAAAGCASDLFFSEYIEGGSYNKALEIANFTGAAVDLSKYELLTASNGAAFNGTYALSGTLADGDVYVLCHSDIADTTNCDVTTTSSVVNFNGDDPRALAKFPDGGGDSVIIDVIGLTDGDPGSGWEVGGTASATADHTIRRLGSINGPNADWATSQASEWEVLAKDTLDGLGSHTYTATCD